jgi:hypothetical protein
LLSAYSSRATVSERHASRSAGTRTDADHAVAAAERYAALNSPMS